MRLRPIVVAKRGPCAGIQGGIEIETLGRRDQALRLRVDRVQLVREEHRFEELQGRRRLATRRSEPLRVIGAGCAALVRFGVDERSWKVEPLTNKLEQRAELGCPFLQFGVGTLRALLELTLQGRRDRPDLLDGRLVPRFAERREPVCGDLDAVVNVQGKDARRQCRSRARAKEGRDDRSWVLEVAAGALRCQSRISGSNTNELRTYRQYSPQIQAAAPSTSAASDASPSSSKSSSCSSADIFFAA